MKLSRLSVCLVVLILATRCQSWWFWGDDEEQEVAEVKENEEILLKEEEEKEKEVTHTEEVEEPFNEKILKQTDPGVEGVEREEEEAREALEMGQKENVATIKQGEAEGN